MHKDNQLFDNHGRPMTYLRLAVTDRCNLRCSYCMPAEGIVYMPERELLTWPEMARVVRVMHGMGIQKVRITGGEPFVRTGLMEFLEELSLLSGLEICLTSNGVLIGPHIDKLKKLGIRSINLSLDALDRDRFKQITRRDDFDIVYENLMRLVEADFEVKVNAVVMKGQNEQDILALAALTKDYALSVRYIEEMPFNGSGLVEGALYWNHARILAELKSVYGDMRPVMMQGGETAKRYEIAGHRGDVGIIAAYSRTFCGTCNRVRLTAKGQVKTCLYDAGVFDLKAYLRTGITDAELRELFIGLYAKRAFDGFEAEKNRNGVIHESMTTIGG
jgi:molybdenum cofactor biosynthesis protein A